MKICVTSQGDSLVSKVDGRFGRCEFFIIWDSIAKNFVAIKNPNIDVASGAGIQSAQLIIEQHVVQVITGDVGPKAKNVLHSANIDIETGMSSSMTVQEVLDIVQNVAQQ